MIVFSLNFDPVEELLKIWCQIYILMKKVIILSKIHMKMKFFAPQFSPILHASAANSLHTVLE